MAREIVFKVRLTRQERVRLQVAAKLLGVSASDVVRIAISETYLRERGRKRMREHGYLGPFASSDE